MGYRCLHFIVKKEWPDDLYEVSSANILQLLEEDHCLNFFVQKSQLEIKKIESDFPCTFSDYESLEGSREAGISKKFSRCCYNHIYYLVYFSSAASSTKSSLKNGSVHIDLIKKWDSIHRRLRQVKSQGFFIDRLRNILDLIRSLHMKVIGQSVYDEEED